MLHDRDLLNERLVRDSIARRLAEVERDRRVRLALQPSPRHTQARAALGAALTALGTHMVAVGRRLQAAAPRP